MADDEGEGTEGEDEPQSDAVPDPGLFETIATGGLANVITGVANIGTSSGSSDDDADTDEEGDEGQD